MRFFQCPFDDVHADLLIPGEIEFVQLRKIFTSVRDGMSKPLDWFEPETSKTTAKTSTKPKTLDDVTKSMDSNIGDAPTPEEMAEDEKAHAADYQLESEETTKGKRGKK